MPSPLPGRNDGLAGFKPEAEDAKVEDLNADIGVGGGRVRIVPSDPAPEPEPGLLVLLLILLLPVCKCNLVKFDTTEGGDVDPEVLFLPAPIPGLPRPTEPGIANAKLSAWNCAYRGLEEGRRCEMFV